MTDITSIRMTSAQTMMRILKEESAESDAQSQAGSDGSAASSYLLDSFGSSSDGDDSDSDYFYSRMDAIRASITGLTTEADQDTGEASADLGSAAFMTALRTMLEGMTAGDGGAKAEAMLSALEAGTLTVTDAETGQVITAWDTQTDKTAQKPATAIEPQGWSDFLKSHLTRGGGATYLVGANGAYVDKTTGNSAHFGTIGDRYVYLSWPAAE